MGTNNFCQRNKYTDYELATIYLRYGSQTEAAKHIDVSRETIARAVRRLGIPLTGRKNNGWHVNADGKPNGSGTPPKITNDELINAINSGMTCKEIAINYNMSCERVYRRARNLGLHIDSKLDGGRWGSRIKRYGNAVFDKSITLKNVITKYDGICQICGKPVDLEDINNGHIGRYYPTVDHIVPISKGGDHTWDNLQLAHMSCNAGKCDRLDYTVKR